MQYQSIIRLLEYCDIDYNIPDVGKMRKILSAEFAIAESGIISIEDFNYTKNDVFQELERADFIQRLEHHKFIWQNKDWLECLEKNTIVYCNIQTWQTLKQNSAFIHFVSPYFADSYDKIMRGYLHPPDFIHAAGWLQVLYFLDNAEDEDKALSGVRIFLLEFIHTLKNVNDVTYIDILPELRYWTNQPCNLFINRLPDSFYNLKEDLITSLVNFMVTIQRANRNLCYDISCKLIAFTNINPTIGQLIKDNHKIFSRKPKEKSKSNWRYIWVFLALLGFIVRVSNTCSHSRSDNSHLLNSMKNEVSVVDYDNLRKKCAVIDTFILNKNVDQDLIVIDNVPYYIVFEDPDPAVSITVSVLNKGHRPAHFHVKDAGNHIVHDFEVKRGENIKIQSNKNVLDVFFSNTGNSNLTMPASFVFVSDSSNFIPHTLSLQDLQENISVGVSEGIRNREFTLEIHLRYIKGDRIVFDFITFPNAHWVHQ